MKGMTLVEGGPPAGPQTEWRGSECAALVVWFDRGCGSKSARQAVTIAGNGLVTVVVWESRWSSWWSASGAWTLRRLWWQRTLLRGGRHSSVIGSARSGRQKGPEKAALLGHTVDLREHRPYAEISCFAPCAICDKAGASKKELEEQLLLDRIGHHSIGDEGLFEGSRDELEEGGGPPEGGGGEASNDEQQRVRDKGKAKVQDS
jgi:hypothetical protein